MSSPAAHLSQCLAQSVEAVCRHYLPGGKRRGRYWIAGDVTGAPGQSLYVRLTGPDSGPGAAGEWTDYVAPKIMLQICARALSRSQLTASTQHNDALREAM
jgi:hypothetical protein